MIYKLIFCLGVLAADVYLIWSDHPVWAIIFFILVLFSASAAVD
jgi:hypothetical protein